MKHIWQSSKKHTSGSFDITENVAGLTSTAYPRAILTFPVNNGVEKSVSACRGLNPGNLEKDLSEPTGVCSFRRSAAPGQALTLYMDQASLYHDIRPELAENLYHLRVTIHGKTMRTQTSRYQRLKELQQLGFRILGDSILTRHDRVSLSIHESNKATGTVQEGPVQNEMLALSQIQGGWWRRLLQLVIDHAVKFPLAIITLVCQLSGRKTFNNPAPEPLLLFVVPGNLITTASPTIRVPTRTTEPALLSFGIMTVSPEST